MGGGNGHGDQCFTGKTLRTHDHSILQILRGLLHEPRHMPGCPLLRRLIVQLLHRSGRNQSHRARLRPGDAKESHRRSGRVEALDPLAV